VLTRKQKQKIKLQQVVGKPTKTCARGGSLYKEMSWHNARSLGVQVISSHIYREGNCCADKLANMGPHCRVWFACLLSLMS